MAEIKEIFDESNPWWKGEWNIGFKDRDIYKNIQKFLPMRQIIGFTGLRRVGKTTLMLKIAQDFIANGFDPKNVLYLSFDDFKQLELRDILNEYLRLQKKNFRSEKFLLLLDEIQKLDGWENQVKSTYDTFGENVKIIISGSESLFIKWKSKESLAGRIFEFGVDALTFKEFLSFKGAKYSPIGIYSRELIKQFDEFTLTLGFPELIGINDKETVKKYIDESIVEKVMYRDMLKLFKINNISLIESLLKIFLDGPGQLIQITDLANELQVSRQTISNYLFYLEESFLLRKLYNFSRNRRKIEKKLKKYYPTIISAELLFKEDILYKSKIFEWIIVNQLKAEFFWRDQYKHEVDMVLIKENKPIPVEIKYGRIEIDGLLSFMKKFDIEQGY
ncbi:hypothetical protein COV16_04635, partial [Candidatus Woesearchaeota archaeon CG10_big_fil_rev_8_21_14_0_10_34_8]